MLSTWGAATSHEGVVYFSKNHYIYSYAVRGDSWQRLKPCSHIGFGLAVVRGRLTAVAGSDLLSLSLSDQSPDAVRWERIYPQMPTVKSTPTAITTPSHLVVAGQTVVNKKCFSVVELLDLDTLQWSSAGSIPPVKLERPHMSLCNGHLYLSKKNAVYSISMEELIKSCKPLSSPSFPTTEGRNGNSVWTRLANIPTRDGASLATLRGHVLAVGGSDERGNPTGAVHCYDGSTDSWQVAGEMPTPQYSTLVAVLAGEGAMVVVGGEKRRQGTDFASWCSTTEIAWVEDGRADFFI